MGMKEEDPRTQNPGLEYFNSSISYVHKKQGVEGHGEGIAKAQVSVDHKNFSWMRESHKIQIVGGRNKNVLELFRWMVGREATTQVVTPFFTCQGKEMPRIWQQSLP